MLQFLKRRNSGATETETESISPTKYRDSNYSMPKLKKYRDSEVFSSSIFYQFMDACQGIDERQYKRIRRDLKSRMVAMGVLGKDILKHRLSTKPIAQIAKVHSYLRSTPATQINAEQAIARMDVAMGFDREVLEIFKPRLEWLSDELCGATALISDKKHFNAMAESVQKISGMNIYFNKDKNAFYISESDDPIDLYAICQRGNIIEGLGYIPIEKDAAKMCETLHKSIQSDKFEFHFHLREVRESADYYRYINIPVDLELLGHQIFIRVSLKPNGKTLMDYFE